MKSFTELPEQDKEVLLRFPAYISLLAANADAEMDDAEKKAAIWLTHIKTFSTEPMLHAFYKEAELVFEKNISQLNAHLSKNKTERNDQISAALAAIDEILKKMRIDYASALRKSMGSYKEHISKAHRNILEYFIFPLPIDGISD